MIVYRDIVVFELQGGVYRLASFVVCVLVEDKDDRSSLCEYDCSKGSDLEPGDFMVIDALGVNGAFGENIQDFAHITSGDAVICSSVD